jgi:hypothetical protein
VNFEKKNIIYVWELSITKKIIHIQEEILGFVIFLRFGGYAFRLKTLSLDILSEK